MIVIGERINTSRAPVEKAVADRDAEYIRQDVQAQEAAGAAYIDVNAAARIGHEMEDMAWLVEVVQDAVDLPLSLDSPDPAVLEQAYALADKPPIINSISLLQHRWVGAIQGEWQIHGVLDHLHQPRHVLHLVPYLSRGVHIYIRRTGRFLSLDVLPDVLGVAVRYCFLYRRPGGIDPFTDDYHDLNPSAVLMAAPASLA